MKQIKLSGGKYAIVDDNDFPYLSRFRWIFTNGQAFATLLRDKMRYVDIPMVHFIIGMNNHYKIGHKNKNLLDNRKSNLFYMTDGKKTHRGKKRKFDGGRKMTSKYKGVCLKKGNSVKMWLSTIQKNKKHYNLGYFKTQKEAALAYNKKAIEIYGKFAYQNKL